MKHFIIIGAGITGLYTALLLKEKAPNIHVTVLEKSPKPGGLFQSGNHFGTVLNHGLFLFPFHNPLVGRFPDLFSTVSVIFEKYTQGSLKMFPIDPGEFHRFTRLASLPRTLLELLKLYYKQLSIRHPETLQVWLEKYIPPPGSKL